VFGLIWHLAAVITRSIIPLFWYSGVTSSRSSSSWSKALAWDMVRPCSVQMASSMRPSARPFGVGVLPSMPTNSSSTNMMQPYIKVILY
jgi:hypothetical protein